MDRAASGDDGAFGALASAAQDELFRFALAHGLRREDAAEATQETLLRAFSGRPRWKDGSNAMAWLCGIAVNVVREFHRRARRQQTAGQDLQWLEAAGEAGPDAAGGRNDLEPDRLRRLAEAMIVLPPRQREAIACRYLRRMSIRETAEAMGCAEGTVKAAVYAALDRLRDILRKDR